MSYDKSMKPKLSNLATVLTLALAIPTSAFAAEFPTLEGSYLNHINYTAAPGKNLIVNPTGNLCEANTDASYWTPNADADCASGSSIQWGWKGTTNGGGSHTTEAGAYTPDLTGSVAKKYVTKFGNATQGQLTLKTAVSVTNANIVYVNFYGAAFTATSGQDKGGQGKLGISLDGVYHEIENFEGVSSWGPTGGYKFAIDLSTLGAAANFSGTINIHIEPSSIADSGGLTALRFTIDDVFLSTDAIFNPPVTDDDLDDDGVLNDDDAFENDAAFSVDTDGDTYPDAFNDPCNEFCEAAKLVTTNTVDAFPDEIGTFTDLTDNGLADQCTIPLTGVAPDEMCGTIPVDYDNDEDGFSNAEEESLGTDPNDPLSFPGDIDGDDIADGDDDLPLNAAASVDSDGDQFPDYFNDPCNAACVAAIEISKPIDAFPDEKIAAHDQDGDSDPTHEGYTSATADMVDTFLTADCKVDGIISNADLASCVDPITGRTLNIDDDIDGDGDSNADELTAGTDPKDPLSNSKDIDGDGWNNEVDEFSTLPLFSQKVTNVLTGLGADADGVDAITTSAGDGSVWFTWAPGKMTNTYTVSVDANEGHNAPNAFLLQPDATVAENVNFQLRSPGLTVEEGQKITHVRLAGWVKITIPDGSALTKLQAQVYSQTEAGTVDPADRYYNPQVILNNMYTSSIDWTYFEIDHELGIEAKYVRVQLAMNQDPGVKVWFDDLELNVINDTDSDGDGISNASDNNDDSVSELADETPTLLDGEDDTPLGVDAQNSDSDTIPDDYDDDFDNDGIANVFDENFNLYMKPELEAVTTATESTLTAVAYDLDDDITYAWTINGTDDAEIGNQLVIANTPDTSGRELVVTVQATSGDETSAVISKTIQMLGNIKNAAPRFGFTTGTTLASDRTFDVSIIDDDGDDFTFYWTLNGEKLETTESTETTTTAMTLLFSNYTENEEVSLSITATDVHGNANTQEWLVIMDNADIDEDGYTNEEEEAAGSDPTNPDSTPLDLDGDGYSNEEEEAGGSDPLDPESNLSDLDFDGWDNVYDTYPTLPLFSQPATNVLKAVGGNGNVNNISTSASDGGWFTWAPGTMKNTYTVKIDANEGHNAPNAFLLQPDATEAENKSFALRGPGLVVVDGQKTTHVRLAGWVKIEIPEGSTLTKLQAQVYSQTEAGQVAKEEKYYNPQIKLHEMHSESTDWTYFEIDHALAIEAKYVRVDLMLNQDPGVKVWFDDLELNVINDIDSDDDGISNALDTDDDNDDEKDGNDATPVGGDATDSDGDMIIDAYDDDLDNDGVHNVFDDVFNPVITALNITDANDITTLTAVGFIDNSAEIEYEWKINGAVQDTKTNSLSFDNLSIEYSGRTFSIEVMALVGELTSETFTTKITIPGEKQNSAPVVTFAELIDMGNGDFVVTASMIDYDPEDADALTFKWFVNGVEVTGYDELTFTVNFADFTPGELVEIAVEISDQKDTVTYTKLVQLNSAPTFKFIEGETILNDEERTTEILLEIADIDGDDIEISWMVNGFPATNSNGDHVVGEKYKLNHYDHRVGATVEIVVSIKDGLSTTEQTLNVTLPEAEQSPDELYPEGTGGGAAYWLMMLLSLSFLGRRAKK